jgi:hypothetical protein
MSSWVDPGHAIVRAIAERALNSMPFLSSSIGANRKSSKSHASRAIEMERVIATIEDIAPRRAASDSETT